MINIFLNNLKVNSLMLNLSLSCSSFILIFVLMLFVSFQEYYFPAFSVDNNTSMKTTINGNSSNTISVNETNNWIETIRSGNTPFSVAANQEKNIVYVTNDSDNTISVIDGSTNTVSATIAV